MIKSHQNIPLKLILYTFENRKYGQTLLFLFLKMSSNSGYIIDDKNIKNTYCKTTGKCERTFENNKNILLKNKWISTNKNKGLIHVNNYEIILRKISTNSTINGGVIWEKNYYTNFSSFIYAVIITYYGRRLLWLNENTEIKKGGFKKSNSEPFYNLPYTYLAKVLNVSKSRVQKMFKKANYTKFIKIEHVFNSLPIPLEQVKSFKKYSENEARKIRVIGKKIVMQETNKFYSSIKLKKRRLKE